MADDMDALGITGIYRYAEIYLKRDVPLKDLGRNILRNSFNRYRNMLPLLSFLPELKKKTEKEFRILTTFYSLYNQQLVSVEEPSGISWGHLGIINQIGHLGLGRGISPEIFYRETSCAAGSLCRNFFLELKERLTDESNS